MNKLFLIIIAALTFSILLFVSPFYLFPEYTFNKIVELEREKAGLKLLSAKVSGTKIKYLQGGSGENLVLLHGFGANKDNWTRIAQYLTGHFKVTAPDLTGFGESDKPFNADYSIEAQMERVINFIDTIGIKKFHIGGSSMGGYISALLTAKYKDRVKSLWLVSPGGVISASESEMYGIIRKGENPLIAEDLESFKNLYNFIFYNKPYIPEPFIRILAEKAASNSKLNRKIFRTILIKPVAIEEALTGCKVPTLIIWGREDRVLHFSGAKVLEKKMDNAKAVIFEKTGHLPMIEKPLRSAEAFLKFHNFSQ